MTSLEQPQQQAVTKAPEHTRLRYDLAGRMKHLLNPPGAYRINNFEIRKRGVLENLLNDATAIVNEAIVRASDRNLLYRNGQVREDALLELALQLSSQWTQIVDSLRASETSVVASNLYNEFKDRFADMLEGAQRAVEVRTLLNESHPNGEYDNLNIAVPTGQQSALFDVVDGRGQPAQVSLLLQRQAIADSKVDTMKDGSRGPGAALRGAGSKVIGLRKTAPDGSFISALRAIEYTQVTEDGKEPPPVVEASVALDDKGRVVALRQQSFEATVPNSGTLMGLLHAQINRKG